jgi:RIO kinase 1
MNACRSVCGPTGLLIPARASGPADDPGGTVPVQPPPVSGQEDRPPGPFSNGQVDGPGSARRERDGGDLVALAGDGQRPVPALGILKAGKEADIFLLRRGVPGTDRSCLLAAKRYRAAEHRMFQRDSEYLEGRRVRESRMNRAITARSAAGRAMISTQWASAEFAALSQLCAAGLPVPYPVQILGTELLLGFIGEPDGTAAPRLAEIRPAGAELASLWDQLVTALCGLARLGYAHGDLSAYNLLVHAGRLVMIDMPQIVDVIANPRGAEFLTRDSGNVARWFTARGLTGATPTPADLAGLLLAEARFS